MVGRSPGRGDRRVSLCRPCRGFGEISPRFPTACAVGYILPPLPRLRQNHCEHTESTTLSETSGHSVVNTLASSLDVEPSIGGGMAIVNPLVSNPELVRIRFSQAAEPERLGHVPDESHLSPAELLPRTCGIPCNTHVRFAIAAPPAGPVPEPLRSAGAHARPPDAPHRWTAPEVRPRRHGTRPSSPAPKSAEVRRERKGRSHGGELCAQPGRSRPKALAETNPGGSPVGSGCRPRFPGQRTVRLIRRKVTHEERNADQRPPAGGKPHRHR